MPSEEQNHSLSRIFPYIVIYIGPGVVGKPGQRLIVKSVALSTTHCDDLKKNHYYKYFVNFID